MSNSPDPHKLDTPLDSNPESTEVKKDIKIIKDLARKWIEDNSVEIHVIRVYNDGKERSRTLIADLLALHYSLIKKFGPLKTFNFEAEFDYVFIKSTNREAINIVKQVLSRKKYEIG